MRQTPGWLRIVLWRSDCKSFNAAEHPPLSKAEATTASTCNDPPIVTAPEDTTTNHTLLHTPRSRVRELLMYDNPCNPHASQTTGLQRSDVLGLTLLWGSLLRFCCCLDLGPASPGGHRVSHIRWCYTTPHASAWTLVITGRSSANEKWSNPYAAHAGEAQEFWRSYTSQWTCTEKMLMPFFYRHAAGDKS